MIANFFKIMKKTLMALVIITTVSCNKSNENEGAVNGFYLGTSVIFSVHNSKNDDLLDPENPHHIDTESIKVFRGVKIYTYI